MPIRRILSLFVQPATAVFLSLALALPASAAPVHGGDLKWVIDREATSLVPLNSPTFAAQLIGTKIFDGLLSYDEQMRPQPQLATRWQLSPDGLSYTFDLQPGVRWQDGRPFTSEDVAFSILRLKQAHPRGRLTFAAVTAVETPSPLQVIVRLSKPTPYLLSAFAATESPIVPKHLYENLPPAKNPPAAAIVGTGPFQLKEWVRGQHVILERNPNYWQSGKPYLDRILIEFSQDAVARIAGFEARRFDIGYDGVVPVTEVERLRQVPHLSVENRPALYQASHRELAFNLDHPYVSDARVRKAIAHALNLELFQKLVYLGHAQIAPSPISARVPAFHDPAIQPYRYDTARANHLLDEAGYPRQANGWRFRLKLLNNPANDPKSADFIRQALRAVGIDVDVSLSDQPTYIRRVYTDRDFDLAIDALSNTFDPALGVHRVFLSRSFQIGLPFSNPSHYSNPKIDALLDQAAHESDLARRQALYKTLQTTVHDELPVLDLVDPPAFVVKNRAVRGELRGELRGAHGLYWNFADTYIEPPGTAKASGDPS
ncbi:MAG: Oligopeptide-binding protein AppA [Paracidovorax wautersii]|uniref:Oligopeptide-binding protein AppA n=1 Tax=Paracidovorax wautersii TaxID=1177982 RepID=A0A7V8JQ02_9BURK|nr:MAG: Oligopeptide-binding protein AppA [Paracidovorax wautersii]